METKGVRWVPAALGVCFLFSACGTESPVTAYEGDPESRELFLGINACNAKTEHQVVESPETVTVTVDLVSHSEGLDCLSRLVVTLEEPLGDRTVMDGITGERMRAPTG